jgi:hypothetical protein
MKSRASRIKAKIKSRQRFKDEEQKQKKRTFAKNWQRINNTSSAGELKRLKDTNYVYNLIKIINKI